MNYLAHLYLSGSDDDIKIGNFIGDYVKGNQYQNFSQGIRQGILMHRQIDAFTDAHPIVRQSAARFKPHYLRYAGVVTDLFYDHFLAANWLRYSPTPLSQYVTDTNRLLMRHYFKLPGEVKRFLPFLVKSRRLESYQTLEGIERALSIMTRYSSLPDKVGFAMQILEIDYNELDEEFKAFFEEVKQAFRGI